MKRLLFIAISLLLASANFWLYFVAPQHRYLVLLVATCLFMGAVFGFVKLALKKVPTRYFLILPLFLVLGFSSLAIFFPNINLPFRLALWLIGTFIFYVNFLILNVFAVALEKGAGLPLLRAAVTVSSLVVSAALFFIFTAIYKIEVIFPLQSGLVFLSTYLINRWYFWSASLEKHYLNFEKEAFLGALVTFEVAVATAFMPLESFFRGFLLISIVYVTNGLLLHRLKHSLSKRVVGEYALVIILVVILLMVFNV